jgi:hypothetical protein
MAKPETTDQPIPCEKILQDAIIADLDDVIVIAKKKGGGLYFASAIPDGADINLLLDLGKRRLLAMIDGAAAPRPVQRAAPQPANKPKLILPN